MTEQKLRINWTVAVVLILLPLFVICGTAAYCMHYGFGYKELLLSIMTYYVANISVGIGLHRLWSHGSYKTNKIVEGILMIISSGTLQGPILAWASDHKYHHAYADTDRDPHTPVKYKSKIKGFLWAHIGWMILDESTAKRIDKHTMATLGKNKALVWQLKNYAAIATFMNIIPPMIFGWLVFGCITMQSTLAGLFFVGLARAIQQNMTFCVNSVHHVMGSRKYANDSSGDIWWLWFLLLGENWHNFHHAFGRDYRNGHKWYHADIHKWIIALMSKCGLAWDLVITPKERIEAKAAEMRSITKSKWQQRLADIESMATKLADAAKQKINAIDKSACAVADNMKTNINNMKESFSSHATIQLAKVEESAQKLAVNIQAIIDKSDEITAKLVAIQMKKLQHLKKAAAGIGVIIHT